MKVIGQKNVVAACKAALQADNHILLCGPSGHGKSHIAKYVASRCGVAQFFHYAAPPNLKRNWLLDNYRVILIVDEIHGSNTQLDWVLFLDNFSGKVVFTTTNPEKLLEPLKNRCITVYLQPYSTEELLEIGGKGCNPFIIEVARGVPRVIKQYAKILGGKTQEEIINLLGLIKYRNFFLYPQEAEYIKVLKTLGGTASRSSIEKQLKIDAGEIEAALQFLGIIKITSRGRSLI